MKKRSGFVSNSSTTTFICVVCDEHEDEMNSIPDGWAACERGHAYCKEHAQGVETETRDDDMVVTRCPVCEAIDKHFGRNRK
jgi:hypothetical protein